MLICLCLWTAPTSAQWVSGIRLCTNGTPASRTPNCGLSEDAWACVGLVSDCRTSVGPVSD